MTNQAAVPTFRKGGIFAYPTESFYALGVDATNPKAVKKLFRIKRREKNKPVALIAGNLRQVRKFFYLSKSELALAKKYWPGGLTILLRPKKSTAAGTLAPGFASLNLSEVRRGVGRGQRSGGWPEVRIGVRVPAHASARRFAQTAGVPLTATSANISGQPPTKSSRKVKRDFPGILVLPGRCGRKTKPSTVVQVGHNHIHILRKGSVHVHPI